MFENVPFIEDWVFEQDLDELVQIVEKPLDEVDYTPRSFL